MRNSKSYILSQVGSHTLRVNPVIVKVKRSSQLETSCANVNEQTHRASTVYEGDCDTFSIITFRKHQGESWQPSYSIGFPIICGLFLEYACTLSQHKIYRPQWRGHRGRGGSSRTLRVTNETARSSRRTLFRLRYCE